MMNRGSVTSLLMVLLVMALGVSGCSDARLQLQQQASYLQSATAANFCTLPATPTKTHLKFVFVIDRSGSNLQNYLMFRDNPAQRDARGREIGRLTPSGGGAAVPLEATDPFGENRFRPIVDFARRYLNDATRDKDLVSWSLLRFSSTAAVQSQGANSGDFFNGIPGLNDFLGLVRSNSAWNNRNEVLNAGAPQDGGSTHYIDAIDKVRALIDSDAEIEKQRRLNDPVYALNAINNQYVIFFVTDGAPWIIRDNSSSEYVLLTESEIRSKVRELMALRSIRRDVVDSIQLHTGFYYADNSSVAPQFMDQVRAGDALARQLLQYMAQDGNGMSLDFRASPIDFSLFSIPTKIPKASIREVWLQNRNILWRGNQLVRDSDGDMVSDIDELRLGGDPNNEDSDGNGLRDGVEFLASSQTQICAPENRTTGQCRPPATPNRRCGNSAPIGPTDWSYAGYIDEDRDGLNFCEENFLGSFIDNFDSNDDFIPDGFAFSQGIDFLPGAVSRDLDLDLDGVTNFFELKRFTPPRFPNGSVPGLRQAVYSVEVVSDNADQTCYKLDIRDAPVLRNDDLFRLMVIEGANVISTQRTIRIAEKRASNGIINFSLGELK